MSLATILIKMIAALSYLLGLQHIWKRRLRGRLAILLYHGVTKHPAQGLRNKGGTHSLASDFERQMRWLSINHKIISLPEAIAKFERREKFDNEVVVTFDDGYRNNLDVAVPICKKYNIRPTVFISAKLVGTKGQMWTDVVERMIASLQQENLSLTIQGRTETFPLTSDSKKLAAISGIKHKLKKLPELEKQKVMKQLLAFNEHTTSSDDDELLTWSEMKRLSKDADIGSHGLDHAMLSRLDDKGARNEFLLSKSMIKKHTGIDVISFAYPNGKPIDFSEKHEMMCKNAGYKAAFSTIPRLAHLNSDRFALPRLSMGGHPDFISFLVRLYFQLFI